MMMDEVSHSPIVRYSPAIAAGLRMASTFVLLGLVVACNTPGPNSATPSPTSRQAKISIQPAQQDAQIGDVFTVTVFIENITSLAGAEIHLAFDSNILEVVDGQPNQLGVQVADGSLLVADLVPANVADNTLGSIDYAVLQLNRPSAEGSGILASIQFRGKAPGTSPITFRSVEYAPSGVLLADKTGQPLPVMAAPGQVTIRGDDARFDLHPAHRRAGA